MEPLTSQTPKNNDQYPFAIKKYHDTEEVMKGLNNLINLPIRGLKKKALENYLAYFDTWCTKSRIKIDEAKKFIPGGAQALFNVIPDLTVLGKIIAGGYPSTGGLGGKQEYMGYLAAGIQSGKKKALVGGTMAANPLSSVAGYLTLCELEKTNAPVLAGLAGDRLTQGLNLLIKKLNLPFVAFNQGSICHLETVGTMLFHIPWSRPWKIPGTIKEIHARKHVMEQMGAAYMAEGIVTLAGSRLYTSAADTDDIIDDALTRFERVFQNIEGVCGPKKEYK